MIYHIDFAPHITKKGGLFSETKVESFDEIMNNMNKWVEENNPTILNVETVVLPNIYEADEEGSEDTMLGASGQSSSVWYQLVRVWYKK